MIRPFSNPKIYTGGVDISTWSELTKAQQQDALSKEWYLYYLFRSPKTDKLVRQPNVKAGVNRYKTKRERLSFLRVLQESLLEMLEAGFDPYKDNQILKEKFFGEEESKEKLAKVVEIVEEKHTKVPPPIIETEPVGVLVSEALKIGLQTKRRTLSKSTYSRYASRINQFEKWLISEELSAKPITVITKKTVIVYLNTVLETTSARNRNNVRGVISSLFNTLEDNEIIKENFIRKINVLKAKTKRNKTCITSAKSELIII